MKILAIYDNLTATFDRYTAITDVKDPETSLIDVLGMSRDPDEPDGFSQWGHIKDGSFDHLGRKVLFEDLPAPIQAHIARRAFNETL